MSLNSVSRFSRVSASVHLVHRRPFSLITGIYDRIHSVSRVSWSTPSSLPHSSHFHSFGVFQRHLGATAPVLAGKFIGSHEEFWFHITVMSRLILFTVAGVTWCQHCWIWQGKGKNCWGAVWGGKGSHPMQFPLDQSSIWLFEACLLMRPVRSCPMIDRKTGEYSPGFRRQGIASCQRFEFVRPESKRAGECVHHHGHVFPIILPSSPRLPRFSLKRSRSYPTAGRGNGMSL